MSKRVAALFALVLSGMAHAAWVEQFSPQGRVDQQTRATVVFSSDMAALGRARASAPFKVDCGAVKGSGRWVDARTWAWQLDRALGPGERCQFVMQARLKALNGEAVTGSRHYRFYAPGPWPRSIEPAPGSAIEEDQAFIILPAGPVQAASVEQNAWCEAEGVGNRIPLRLLTGKLREDTLAAANRSEKEAVVASCSERLPAGGKMKLVWGKGIVAENGAVAKAEEGFAYAVREPFRATLSCERESSSAPCSPLSRLSLEFSAPVDAALRGKIRLQLPGGERRPDDPAVAKGSRENTARNFVFSPPFPQNAELRLELPSGIKDEAGRALTNSASFPLRFAIAGLPPLAKFPGDFGVIERGEGSVLPVTLRNVEATLRLAELRLTEDAAVIATMQDLARFNRQTRTRKLLRDGKPEDVVDPHYARELSFLARQRGVTRRDLPKPGGSAEFEVLGIPLAKPGYHVVEIESRMLGKALLGEDAAGARPMYVRAAALATNMAVHFKRGTENALVWVTALDSGKPVANAAVRISDCKGKLLWEGSTDSQGRALAQRELALADCEGSRFLFASARAGDDYSFVRSDWDDGIEPWRFGIAVWGETSRSRLVHTVFDRTLLRPGQTLSMKHVARERNTRGMGFVDPVALPEQAVIRHEGGDEFKLPLSWDARGVALGSWKVPEAAKRGSYRVELRSTKGPVHGGNAEFRVADFRLPVFTGSVQGIGQRFVAPRNLPLALGLSFLNGGAARGHAVQVSATLRPTWPTWAGYDGYVFNVDFNESALEAFNVENDREREQLMLDKKALTLDAAGAGEVDVPLGRKIRGPAELYAEMSFRDPNGEIQTIHGAVPLWPSAVVVGMRLPDRSSQADRGQIDLVVLDLDGKPMAGQPVEVKAKRRVSHSHRRRVVGGFYAYENRDEFTDLGRVCRGRTDTTGHLLCEPDLKDAGEVFLLAEVRDARGNLARSGSSVWIAGAGDDPWFAAGNQDRIDVVPERASYQAGETARLRVHTPFREGTALVAVEAGGIVQSFVRPLSRFNPYVEVPVKAEWAPNIFVSVLVVRGRVVPLKWYSFFQWGWREPLAWFREWWNPSQPTAMVDLAKPSWRFGLADVGVGTEAMRLKVDILPDRSDYRLRDQAAVRVKLSTPNGTPLPKDAELAFAAVDQALLELRPNESWKLLEAMTPRRAYEVNTATVQSQVIGKRHYGRKAVPVGGGGGRAPARELFDTLLTWQPRVKVGADGTAVVKVPINDSLTEFTLVGVASAGTSLFGTGTAAIRTRQDLQMISGLPPLVRENDRYQAMLTLRNGTARPMSVSVTGRAGKLVLAEQRAQLPPGGASEVNWNVTVPEGAGRLDWSFDAKEEKGTGRDSMRVTQQVAAEVPVTVQQASFLRIDGKIDLPVALPKGALRGRGGIEIGLAPTLSARPPGLQRFFEDYPFACLEQRASTAVGLHDEKRWQDVVASLPALLDGNGLARYFPYEAPGSVPLTAYLLDIAHASGLGLPDDLRARMEDGLTGFVEARFKQDVWAPSRTDARLAARLQALEALSRNGRAPAKAVAALAPNLQRLPTSSLIDWYLVVRRTSGLPLRLERLAAAERELRNRMSYSGGRLTFSTEKSDNWWWMMASGDANAFRLIEATAEVPAWRGDLPKMLRGALERQHLGHWRTTTANAWAAIALDRFGREFERESVAGTTRASLGSGKTGHLWTSTEERPNLSLPWTPSAATLNLSHEGLGKPWATVQALAAMPDGGAQANGFRIRRKVVPLEEKVRGKVSRGDLWRVTLDIEAEQDMSWVVVSDPIPAGARILGDGDGRDSRIASAGEDQRGRRLWPRYVERSFATYRAYYELVPRGRFRVDYTLRINNAGEFAMPPTRVEGMYAPDVFGELPRERLVVAP